MPNKYKGPSTKQIFGGFQALQDQIEEDRYFSGEPMTPAEAEADNQARAMRADLESRRKSENIARGFQEGSRVSPGYEPRKIMLKEIKKPSQGGARPPKKQKMMAKINARKAYDS